jgi:hypothetical protein
MNIKNVIPRILELSIIFLLYYNRNNNLDKKQEILSLIVELSGKMIENSRNYILTGNEKFKNKYNELLEIIEGNGKWDKVTPHIWFRGHSENFRNIIKILNFDSDEKKISEQIRTLIHDSIWDEISAINNYDGKIDINNKSKLKFDEMENKKFIPFKPVEDDEVVEVKKKSINILFGVEYIERYNEIHSLEFLLRKKYFDRITNIQRSVDVLILILILIYILYIKYVV